MSRPGAPIAIRHALVLGLLHGPTELLPVSSSAHTALLTRLAGWSAAELDPELSKTLEVALHTGAALALTIALRQELGEELRQLDRRRLQTLILALLPPAVVGYTLEGPIERRLGGPRTIACGLFAGAIAMALADLRSPLTRSAAQATPSDGLGLGLAQALALFPGISRNGATLTAARAQGFTREAAQTLSWHVALPVLFGASALKGWRLVKHGAPKGFARLLVAGTGAAFLSTLACAPLIFPRRQGRALLPFALYRCALAIFVARGERTVDK